MHVPSYDAIDAAVCGSCAHFRRHYAKIGSMYSALAYGHCVYPRLKKQTDGQTCPHWAPAELPEDTETP